MFQLRVRRCRAGAQAKLQGLQFGISGCRFGMFPLKLAALIRPTSIIPIKDT